MTIHLALVEHRHCVNTYASESQQTVLDALEAYCRDNWTLEAIPGNPDVDTVVAYFEHARDESYIITETELL